MYVPLLMSNQSVTNLVVVCYQFWPVNPKPLLMLIQVVLLNAEL